MAEHSAREALLFGLNGKKALVIGIANEDSIAFGCAKAFREQGAELAITFQNDKAEAAARAPTHQLASIADVGAYAAFWPAPRPRTSPAAFTLSTAVITS